MAALDLRRSGSPNASLRARRMGGFTLLELMIVVTIVGILATMAFPTFQRYVVRAREASLRNSLFVFRDSIDQFYADMGRYPSDLGELVARRYIRAIPEDPFTRSRDSWITLPPPDGSGVYDVHSGSHLVSLDGTPYNEW